MGPGRTGDGAKKAFTDWVLEPFGGSEGSRGSGRFRRVRRKVSDARFFWSFGGEGLRGSRAALEVCPPTSSR